MIFTLRENKDLKVRYSPLERQAFAMLPQMKQAMSSPVDSLQLAGRLFGKKINGRQMALGLVTSLQTKAQRNREPFRIRKSKRNGPWPIEFWVEARKK